MSRFQRTLILLGAVASLVAACTGGDDDAEPGDPAVDPSDITTSGFADPSSRQLEMIADGEVTFEEYEEAFFAYIQCALDAGIRIREEPRLDAHGQYYSASFSMGAGAEYETNRLNLDTCQDRHLLSVLVLYADTTRPSESVLQKANEAVVSCLATNGIEMPSHLSLDDFAILLEAAASGDLEHVPPRLSLNDLEPLLIEAPDPGALFLTFLSCRDEAAQQYPVGW